MLIQLTSPRNVNLHIITGDYNYVKTTEYKIIYLLATLIEKREFYLQSRNIPGYFQDDFPSVNQGFQLPTKVKPKILGF